MDQAARPDDRRYAVMTDSHRVFDGSVLARKAPDCSKADGFWTEDAPDEVWIMDRATAEDIRSRLHLNNPRIVRAEKAIGLITAQRDALRAAAAPVAAQDAPDGDPRDDPAP
ncbi:hypothetical protein [Defluviimonas salinarum]|uniref:Uncharacterized protein n=1 Tax=Defluviimonas salinarum TaxID=2992147 RepID=A0ABT3J8C1_9RHOB|nr:hypothetical protein [Defluviimonas salinarum]MCW3783911.1 hypothetical protein [Defluviimonas salinarum]